jgi:hypothetical protein
MAIDTAARRYSAMNPMCPWRHVGVVPDDDDVDSEAQRGATLTLYSGLFDDAGAAPSSDVFLTNITRHRRRLVNP